MELVSHFFDQNMVIVFFFYGLAFFSMGLAVWMEAGRSSDFSGVGALLFLAGFGLLHGIHEWLEVFTILKVAEAGSPAQLILLELLRVAILAISFLFLIMYGLGLIFSGREKEEGRRLSLVWTAVFAAAWLLASLAVFWIYRPCGVPCLETADVLSRYMLAMPGALLAAWGMFKQRGLLQSSYTSRFAQDFTVAAVALVLYGVIGQIFTRTSLIFPSTIINSDLFRAVFGFPVQLFRGVMAAVVAVFVIRSLRAVEEVRRQKFEAANEARLEAQAQALETQRKAHAEAEELNRELQTAVQDLAMLFDLSQDLAKTLDRDQMLAEAITRIYKNVPRIKGGLVMLRDRPDHPLKIMAKAGYEQNLGNGSGSETAVARATMVGQEVVARADYLCWTGYELLPIKDCPCTTGEIDPAIDFSDKRNRTVGMPILVEEEYAGSIVLSIDGDSGWLAPNDISLIRTVASQLGLAVSNAVLYEKVQAREVLRGELLQQVTSAQEHERQRIARELHDSVGQRATALGLGLAAAGDLISSDPESGRRQLLELREMNNELVLELQQLIAGLRPSLLDDFGLVPAVKSQLRQLERQAGVTTRFLVDGDERRLESEMETIIFRIAQEGITNVAKHAQASFVLVRLSYFKDDIRLLIEDDGCGYDMDALDKMEPYRRWGLIGIRERVELVGGSYEIVSAPGMGTTLRIRLPVNSGIEVG
jgi:signal transduction histidine kinase